MPHEAKGMRWGEEERTSLPDPQIHTDDPTPLGYGGMIPSHLFHIEQHFQYQWIDLPLLISKIKSAVHPKCFTGEGGQKYRTNRNSISNII